MSVPLEASADDASQFGDANEEHQIVEINWYPSLVSNLTSYMNVLRYELDQVPAMRTLEALVHAEIYKILTREFPRGNVQNEYPIGNLFKGVESEDATGSEDAGRRFRADIAIFHPANRKCAETRPIVVFEIKRTGPADAIWADIYRLVVVSANLGATGYLVLAAPHKELIKLVAENAVLKELDKDRAKTVEWDITTFNDRTNIYPTGEHNGKTSFFGQLLFDSSAQFRRNRSRAGTDHPDEDFGIRIFGFRADGKRIATDQVLQLAVRIKP